MKKIFIFYLILFIFLSFLGCQSKEDTTSQNTDQPTDIITTEISNQNQYTFSDFYSQFIDCKEHIDNILSNQSLEQDVSFEQNVSKLGLKEMSMAETEMYTREEILEAHNQAEFDLVNEDYLEQLISTELFMDDIQTLLEYQEDIALFEPFHPEDDPSITYEFIIPEPGYILIDALYDNSHLYLKMGLNNDLLDYQEFHYYFSSDSLNPKDDIEMTFNYFKFLEDKEAVYVNYLDESASLRYTNIEDDEQIEISRGSNIIEGTEYDQTGYVLSLFDRETNVRSFLQIIEDEIIGEAYDVFDAHGSVYRYSDYDFYDGIKKLQINIATATGWDYVVASDYSNDDIDALTGIFINDGTKIFDGRFNCTYTTDYGFVGIWLDLDESTEITNDLFSLNQYGMNLNHPKANIEYLNQIRINNVENVKNQIQIEALDFFVEDIQQELYNYIDQDIRDDLEGNNDTPIETTGDVEAFMNALNQFNNQLAETPQYHTDNTVTTTILDEQNNKLTETTIYNAVDFDLNAMYYRNYTRSGPTDYAYVIDGTKGQLMEFEINQVAASYYIISEEANNTNFMEAYGETTGNDLSFDDFLNGVISITQIDNTTFEFEVTTAFLSGGGVDINTLLEQQGIQGLDQQSIIITYQFNEDYSNFDISYTLNNLTYEDNKVEITSHTFTSIEEVTIHSPQDLAYLIYVLPQSIDQTAFEFVSGPGDYAINRGTSYLRLNLEPGEYSLTLDGLSRDPEFIILDKDLNTISYEDGRFEATYAGDYYIEISSTLRQSLTVYLRNNPTPVFHEFDLDAAEGQLEINLNLNGMPFYFLNIPSETYDRLLVIEPYSLDVSDDSLCSELELRGENHETNYYENCSINENLDTCYLYLPANEDITFEISGHFTGDIGFNYDYDIIPQGEFDNTHTWNDLTESINLWMTDDSPVAHVDFTIEESGTYELNTFYKDFGYSYQDAGLYKSDGTQITYNWDYALTLEPGDYYIEFTSDYSSTLLVMIIAEIIQE